MRKALDRPRPQGYVEKHHVFPKSIFGNNRFVVCLTAKEHFIAHALLEKACIQRYGPTHNRSVKMTHAFNFMCNDKTTGSSILFAAARKRHAERLKGNTHARGQKLSEETKQKMRDANRPPVPSGKDHHWWGRQHSQETIKKMKASNPGMSFKVRSPDGEVHEGRNCKAFCEKHGLSRGQFSSLINGHIDHIRGWTLG